MPVAFVCFTVSSSGPNLSKLTIKLDLEALSESVHYSLWLSVFDLTLSCVYLFSILIVFSQSVSLS